MWAKGLKGSDEGGGGCTWAVVARERVSWRADSEGRRRCCCCRCCCWCLNEAVLDVVRDSAGQSHGRVSFRPTARVSILPMVVASSVDGGGVSNEMDARRNDKKKDTPKNEPRLLSAHTRRTGRRKETRQRQHSVWNWDWAWLPDEDEKSISRCVSLFLSMHKKKSQAGPLAAS